MRKPITRRRSRSRMAPRGTTTTYNANGTIYYHGPSGVTVTTRQDSIEDVISKTKRTEADGFPPVEQGLTPVSPMRMVRVRRHPVFIDSFRPDGKPLFRRVVAHVSNLSTPPCMPSASQLQAQLSSLSLKLWAMTNPFRYEVSVPVVAAELVEVASLFRLAVGTFASKVAGNYLNIQFGWKPFLADLKTLSEITTIVESRMREIESLSRFGGLRRSGIFLHSDTVTNSLEPNYNGAQFRSTSALGPVRRVGSYKVYGSCRWGFTGTPPSLDKLETFNLALRKALDLETPSPSTIWEMIPFSWLVDYFVDIGTWLQANDGHLEVYPFDTCLTYRAEGTTAWTHTSTSNPDKDVHFSGEFSASERIHQRFVVANRSTGLPSLISDWLSPVRSANVIALLTLLSERSLQGLIKRPR